jgi:hypothetical protein
VARTDGETSQGHRPRRERYLWALLSGIVVGVVWIAVGTTMPPLRQTCDAALSAGACSETVVAALKKGMPQPHPLLLAAHAAPGPQARNDQLGHRATVTFEVLGAPGSTTVKLYFDMGAHWGGVVDRSQAEMTAWSLAQGAVVAVVVAAATGWLVRRRETTGPS